VPRAYCPWLLERDSRESEASCPPTLASTGNKGDGSAVLPLERINLDDSTELCHERECEGSATDTPSPTHYGPGSTPLPDTMNVFPG